MTQTLAPAQLSKISAGHYGVYRRGTGINLGFVEQIDWPHSIDGQVSIEKRWQACDRYCTVAHNQNPFSCPTFSTRRAAVDYLAAK